MRRFQWQFCWISITKLFCYRSSSPERKKDKKKKSKKHKKDK